MVKVKLYAIAAYGPSGPLFSMRKYWAVDQVATFTSFELAQRVAYLLAGVDKHDWLVERGRREHIIAESTSYVLCPHCDARWRYSLVAHKLEKGVHRCDCGCLFELDGVFNGHRATMLDLSAPENI